MNEAIEAGDRAGFRVLGVHKVRHLLGGDYFSPTERPVAEAWLEALDSARNEAMTARAFKTAWRANTIAIAAAMIAAISMATSIATLWVMLHSPR